MTLHLFPPLAVELVYPDRLPVAELISWARAARDVASLPEKAMQSLLTRHIEAMRKHDNPSICVLAETANRGDRATAARCILLGAALGNAFPTIIAHADAQHGYELMSEVWHGRFSHLCDPIMLAGTGIFGPSPLYFPKRSLTARLSGSSVFVSKCEIKKLARGNGCASEAELVAARRAISADLGKGRDKISQPEFASEMRESTGASSRRIAEQWSLMDAKYKYLGRPPEGQPNKSETKSNIKSRTK